VYGHKHPDRLDVTVKQAVIIYCRVESVYSSFTVLLCIATPNDIQEAQLSRRYRATLDIKIKNEVDKWSVTVGKSELGRRIEFVPHSTNSAMGLSLLLIYRHVAEWGRQKCFGAIVTGN